jgi:AAA domain
MTRSIDFEGINKAARSNGRSLLIALIPGGKFNSSEYTVRNPSRADKNAGSFSINCSTGKWADFATGAKGGDIISWYAHARGLEQAEAARQIAKKLGISAYENTNGAGGEQHRLVCAYDYADENGKLLHQTVRYAPKKFLQRRPDPDKPAQWIWKLDGVRTVLFLLRDVIRAVKDGKPVYIVEGERDALALRELGLTATCNPMGAGKWRAEYSESLRYGDVVVVGDNDEPGRKHVEQVACSLDGVAKRIRVLDLSKIWSDCPEHGDVSNWVKDGGGTLERLQEVVGALPDWKPTNDKKLASADYCSTEYRNERGWRASILQASDLQRMAFPPAREIVLGYIPEGATLLVGKPKIGKSWLTLDLCIAATANRFVLGTLKPVQGDVLYLALEDSPRRIKKRIFKLWPSTIAKWPEQLHLTNSWRRAHEGGIEDIAEWCRSVPNPVMVVIDTLEKFRAPADGRKGAYSADYEAVAALQKLALEHRMAVVIVHHDRKMDADDPFDTVSGTLGLTGAADTILIVKRRAGAVTLYARGRDIEEKETALQFEKRTCRWTILGAASEVYVSSERATVLEALKSAGEGGLSVRELMAATETENRNAMDKLLLKMVGEGRLVRPKRGVYAAAETDLPDDWKIAMEIDEDAQDIEDIEDSPSSASDLPNLPDLPEIRETPDPIPDPIPTTQNQGRSGRLGRSRDGDPQAGENTENIEPSDLPDNLPEILAGKIDGGTTVIDL